MTADSANSPAGAEQAQLSEGVYEFSGDENERIDRVGSSSSIWGLCAIVGGLLLAVLATVQFFLDNFRGAILVVPLLLVCALVGGLYRSAGSALTKVVTTEGNDVELLMQSLDRLARAFRIEVIVIFVAALVFAGLAVVVGV